MSGLRFDGQVAVVTGAGRGLGRAYALLLAERGASVVVNDIGAAMEGGGADTAPAEAVAQEIADAGGTAVADHADLADPDGGAALIARAVEAFGRVDAVVNNAGIIRWAGPAEADAANFDDHIAVHLAGSFHTVRAAWPHFVAQGYGRIVNTTSSGVFGLPANLSYAAAKGGVIGLTRSLAVAGEKCGILANAIAPAASTRMAGQAEGDEGMAPELAAPMAAYLAHADCPVTGEIYAAGAGRFARVFIATAPGYVHGGPAAPTIEDVAGHWDEINDEAGAFVPADLMAWSQRFLAHRSGSRP